jgi:hypothetical protein
MKLVTGIEAIQSGKPWKHKDNDEWIDPDSDTQLLTPRALQTRVYIIKEEAREFWIRASDVDSGCEYCGVPISSTNLNLGTDGEWVKVREIEK